MQDARINQHTPAGRRFLLLPDWLDSGAAHWQRCWEARPGCERVQQDDWRWPRRGDWMARLDEVLLADSRAALLIAHGLGCQLVAAWASHSRHTDRVRAALLVAAPDTERADAPPNLFNWRPIARGRLPFPSRVVVSSNDPYCTPDRAAEMARQWGSTATLIGPCGHLDGASDLGDWPAGWAYVQSLST
jgi:predicted alpha/beta hydrolase family esterase